MKLVTFVALASMAALASADNGWRIRFYNRTQCKGGAIVDDRSTANGACTNIPVPLGPAVSMQFEVDSLPTTPPPPHSCTATVWTGAGCTGTSATYTRTTTGTTSVPDFTAVSPPGAAVRSYTVTCV